MLRRRVSAFTRGRSCGFRNKFKDAASSRLRLLGVWLNARSAIRDISRVKVPRAVTIEEG